MSHRARWVSQPPVKRQLPFDDEASALTGPLCPLRDEIFWIFKVAGAVVDARDTRDRRPVPSWEVLAMRCDSELDTSMPSIEEREEAARGGNTRKEVTGPS